MIAQECKKLRGQLEELAQAEERENIHDQLESRRNELVDVRDSLLAVTNSLKALSARTELAGDLDPTKCIDRVRKIRESLQTDPLSITKGRQFSDMRKAFEKFATEGTECAQATWAIFMPRAKPSVDTNQLAQAEQQNDFKTIALKLKTRAKYAEKLGKNPPATEDDFAELESAWEDIREMMAALPDVASDPLVQEFLKAANSSGGASIDLLTDEVRAWLQENNIADKYRITTM
ncbi:hypothetical protein [Allorhodopirellula solitaria]|uniref:Uncharacterized protein n=1 Tax=Allorhodopirellula solitaria TaxID=2527987 RepID=A0A5C5WNT7_9BACT|nr:hypothetical protein [Allorhodopirellula solitaria]TWT52267.1 hypothetical protein CA85_50470 [Allorhodopirellula solitaria]